MSTESFTAHKLLAACVNILIVDCVRVCGT